MKGGGGRGERGRRYNMCNDVVCHLICIGICVAKSAIKWNLCC